MTRRHQETPAEQLGHPAPEEPIAGGNLPPAEQSPASAVEQGFVKKSRGLDPELQAMAKIDRVLAEFPETAVHRIIAWLIGRYRMEISVSETE